MEKKKLSFSFDPDGDVLDISIGAPQKAISEEVSEDVFVRIDPKTKEIVGFMIMNLGKFLKKIELQEKPITTSVPA